MDALDKRILTAMQADLPLVERPFEALAERLDVGPDDLQARVRRMAEAGLIRRIGPVFDSGRLGYQSTLVAARVRPEQLDRAAERVGRLPGVTHNYERRGPYNLWFTLTVPPSGDLDRALDRLRAETGAEAMHSLPALARYKIRATFDLDGSGEAAATAGGMRGGQSCPPRETPQTRGVQDGTPRTKTPPREAPVHLTEAQRTLVRAVQDGLPVEAEPFVPVAEAAGWTVRAVLDQVRAWLDAGVVRRFGAVVRHRAAGVRANAMAVFRVAPSRIDAAGRALASHPDVTHCYRRPPLPDFPYTLYAMVHGESEEAVRERVEAMAGEIDADAWVALFSVREFKKTSMRYFTEGRGGSRATMP
ncbi:MAG: AsnC family transcriptional regulator [Phycisphaerae bacterium]